MDVGRPATEREVLRVLWESPERLVRSQIYRQMPQSVRPTLGRVGQILTSLHAEELLEKVVGRAQGAKKAGFYGLTEQGREVCRELGFEYQERQLFSVPEHVRQEYLTRERFRRRAGAPERVMAVYSCRGGLGRTTLVAHVGKGLAERLESQKEVLVVDLDLRISGLDDYFDCPQLATCRGFGGLLIDFERREKRKRSLWLRGALRNPEYVIRPLPEVPGLKYLPSGLVGQGALSASERTEALALLRAEAGLSGLSGVGAIGFLSDLRQHLRDQFAWTVIDTDFGQGFGAYVATQNLANQLIICAQVADTAAASLNILRSALTSYLQLESNGARGEPLFLFRLTEPTNREDLDLWIERHLVLKDTKPESPGSYRAEQLPYDARLARHRHRWANTHFYKHVIAQVDPASSYDLGTTPPPPELQALLAVLDPEQKEARRSIAVGVLESARFQDLARCIDWYVRDKSLHKETDGTGRELIDHVASGMAIRLRRAILGPQATAALSSERRGD